MDLPVSTLTLRFTSSLSLTGRVLALHDKRRRKPGQEASKFKMHSETGRMIIDVDNSDSDVPHSKSKPEYADANLYKESLTSVDGFTRGPNGKVKFHKDTKKRRREEMSEDDVEMADIAVEEAASKSRKRDEFKVGHEFKAKVRCVQLFFEKIRMLTGYIIARRRRYQEERYGAICICCSWTSDWWQESS